MEAIKTNYRRRGTVAAAEAAGGCRGDEPTGRVSWAFEQILSQEEEKSVLKFSAAGDKKSSTSWITFDDDSDDDSDDDNDDDNDDDDNDDDDDDNDDDSDDDSRVGNESLASALKTDTVGKMVL